jgi:pyrrolidone-carboxylate peptidase
MKVLVTGFEPFGPWQRNPSGETASYASPLFEEVPVLTSGKGMRLKKWIEFTEAVLYLLRTVMV